MTMSCFLQVVYDSVLFSSSCVCQCLVFFKFADQCQKDKTSGSAQVKVHQQLLISSCCIWQCLVFFKLYMRVSCFLQVLCDKVLFSSSYV